MQLEDQLNDSQSNLSYLKSNLQHMEEQTTAEKKETLKYLFVLLFLYKVELPSRSTSRELGHQLAWN